MTKNVNIRLKIEEYEYIKKLAKDQDRSISSMIHMVIKEHKDNKEKKNNG